MQISEISNFWKKKNVVSTEESEYLPNFEQKYQKAKLEMQIREVLYSINDNLTLEELERIINIEMNKMNCSLDEESVNYLRNISNSIETRKRQVKEILADMTVVNSLYPHFSFFKDVQIKNHTLILKCLNPLLLLQNQLGEAIREAPIIFSWINNDIIFKSIETHELEHKEFYDDIKSDGKLYMEKAWRHLENKNWDDFQKILQININGIRESRVKTELIAFFIEGYTDPTWHRNIEAGYDPIHFGPVQSDFYNFLKKSNLTRSEKVFAESKFWQIYNKRYDGIGLCWQAIQNLKRKGVERENMSALMRDLPLKDWWNFAKSATLKDKN